MMKSNYLAWSVIPRDFHSLQSEKERLTFLLNFAILAPSSHNTQPWKFIVEKNIILVYPNENRRLSYSDQNDRQLYISLGCAVTNLTIAADYYGYNLFVEYIFDSSLQKTGVKITLNPGKNRMPSQDHLIFSIPRRITDRGKYDNRLPSDSFFELIKSFEVNDLTCHCICDVSQKNAIADLALLALGKAMGDKDFRNELSHYVKSNVTTSSVGMPGFGLGFPLPVSFVVPHLLKKFNMSKVSYKGDEVLLKKNTPFFITINTKNDDQVSWLKAGQVYEKIALAAEKEGMRTSIWAAPVQIGEYYKDIQNILNIPFRPQVFFRIGYSNSKLRHSPRHSIFNSIA